MDLTKIHIFKKLDSFRDVQAYLGVGVQYAKEVLVRTNCLSIFNFESSCIGGVHSDLIKKSIRRKYFRNVTENYLSDIMRLRAPERTKGPMLEYLIRTSKSARKTVLSIYSEENSWGLARRLSTPQKSTSEALRKNNLTSYSRVISKAHLRIKKIIHRNVGPTISEFRIESYRIDEFSPKIMVAFEIDGAWCHNSAQDREKDKFLLSRGIKVIRIDSLLTDNQVEFLLKEKLRVDYH